MSRLTKFDLITLIGVFFISSIIGFKPLGFDRDSIAYYNASLADKIDYRWIEPSFAFISFFNRTYLYSSAYSLFFIYAFLALIIKIYCFRRLSDYFSLSIVLYFLSYFLIFEITQIRAAVAVSFFLASIISYRNNHILESIIFVAFSILFHYSAAVFFIIFFLHRTNINLKFWFLIPFLGYLFSFFSGYLETIIPNFLANKIMLYIGNGEAPLISLYRISLLLIYWYLLLNYKLFFGYKYFVILIKLLGLSIFFYALFHAFSAGIAVRISGLFSISLVFLLPLCLKIFRPKALAMLLVLSFGLFNLFYLIFVQSILSFNVFA